MNHLKEKITTNYDCLSPTTEKKKKKNYMQKLISCIKIELYTKMFW